MDDNMLESTSIKEISHVIDACISKYCTNDLGANCLLLCGSRAVGLDISRSDLDISVIVDDSARYGVRDGQHIVDIIEGMRVELLVMTVNLFRANLFSLEKTGHTIDMLNHPLDKFVHALPVWGDDKFKEISKSFNQLAFRESFIELAHSDGANIFEDILGALESNKLDLAIIWVRNLVSMVMDALLAKYNDFYCRPKWKLERVLRHIGKESHIYNRYRKIMLTSDISNNENALSWVHNSLMFIRVIQNMIFDIDNQKEAEPSLETIANSDNPVQYLTRKKSQYLIISDTQASIIDEKIANEYLNINIGYFDCQSK
jgi:hypothetical protein